MSFEFLLTTLIIVATPALAFVIFSAYGVFAAAVKHVVSRPRVLTWMRWIFAGSFVALGARLAVTSRS